MNVCRDEQVLRLRFAQGICECADSGQRGNGPYANAFPQGGEESEGRMRLVLMLQSRLRDPRAEPALDVWGLTRLQGMQ
jgi:hypothetical protein